MRVFSKLILFLMSALRNIGLISVALVMFIITAGVVSRLLGNPILGAIELAEILHLVLIMFSFSYTQTLRGHISIGLLVDRFPEKIQRIFDNIAYVLTIIVSMLFSYIFLQMSMDTTETTLLLAFPHSILKIIITIGFFGWGLVSIIQLLESLIPSRKEVSKDV